MTHASSYRRNDETVDFESELVKAARDALTYEFNRRLSELTLSQEGRLAESRRVRAEEEKKREEAAEQQRRRHQAEAELRRRRGYFQRIPVEAFRKISTKTSTAVGILSLSSAGGN